MRITRVEHHGVEVNKGGSWVFVQVHTDRGLTGLGELNPSADRRKCLEAIGQIATQIAGDDPRRIDAILDRLPVSVGDRPSVHALSAVEQALWDLHAQAEGCPIYELLGARCRDQIRLYANISRILVHSTPEEFAGNATRAVAEGFDAIKIAPFSNRRFAADREGDIANGIECARAVRAAIGPDVDLLVDCYGIFTREEGLRIARSLDALNLYWLEEPVEEDDVEGYLAVRKATSATIAGGERFMRAAGFEPALRHRMMDVVMPDVTIVGGIRELYRVAQAASAHRLETSPHGPFGPITVAAHVQLMAAHPDFQILEYAWGQVPWRADLIEPRETVENGRLAIPDRPGLGFSLNPAVVAAHPYAN